MKKLKNLEESSGKYQWYHSIEIADGVYTKSTIPHFKEKWDFNLSAIVHHLVFKQKESFETIVEKIARYTDRWLPIEFIPKEDKYVWKYFERWPDYHKKFDWYNTENFLECLRKEFSTVEVLPSNPDPRILVLCER